MTILVTGCAGFIGFYVTKFLLKQGFDVIGIDNLNSYYNIELKNDRLNLLRPYPKFDFYRLDICKHDELLKLNEKYNFELVVHLAAQAGVRYSLENPFAYIKSNVEGHLSILEFCLKIKNLKKLVYASSSAVYGGNLELPFSINQQVDNPISLYAATKRADELMSRTYYNLHGLTQVGLRFFTVYGPYGRPDMAPQKFANAIMKGEAIDVYNNGKMKRDFTYIDDIIDGIYGAINLKHADHRIYNLGNNKSVELMEFIETLETLIGKKAIINYKPMQKGEVLETLADITESERDLGFSPKTEVKEGLRKLVEWLI